MGTLGVIATIAAHLVRPVVELITRPKGKRKPYTIEQMRKDIEASRRRSRALLAKRDNS